MRWQKDVRNNRIVGYDHKTDDILAIIVMDKSGVPLRGYLWKQTLKGRRGDIMQFVGVDAAAAKLEMEVTISNGNS